MNVNSGIYIESIMYICMLVVVSTYGYIDLWLCFYKHLIYCQLVMGRKGLSILF